MKDKKRIMVTVELTAELELKLTNFAKSKGANKSVITRMALINYLNETTR